MQQYSQKYNFLVPKPLKSAVLQILKGTILKVESQDFLTVFSSATV